MGVRGCDVCAGCGVCVCVCRVRVCVCRVCVGCEAPAVPVCFGVQ